MSSLIHMSEILNYRRVFCSSVNVVLGRFVDPFFYEDVGIVDVISKGYCSTLSLKNTASPLWSRIRP